MLETQNEARGDASSSAREGRREGGGPLTGLRVLEFAGIGPVQFTGMMLADMGADVVRIDRTDGASLLGLSYDVLDRGRRSIALDLKQREHVAIALRLIERVDVLIEGYRPGVMERLGLGPDVALARNSRLVFGRVTGWGQHGPLAQAAGHDINYIALTGALHAIGTTESGPVIPLNMVGDFGGGGMLLAFGVLSALYEAQRSGRGQVVDAAMTDGAAALMAMIYGMHAEGKWRNRRSSNLLDGGTPFYGTYACADGRWVAIGPLEPKFYAQFLALVGLDDPAFRRQMDQSMWPELRQAIAAAFRERTRDQWCERLEGTDVCFAPVLDLDEAPGHPHNSARRTFVTTDGVTQPAPAPRFSRTPGSIGCPPPARGKDTAEVLAELGLSAAEVAALTPEE